MDDFTNDELEQLMGVFKDQADNILDEMSHNIMLLESDPSNLQTMAQLRRSVHTIKGDSACIGLDRITELTHRLEDIIEAAREGELELDSSTVDVLLQCVDQIRFAVCGPEVQDITDDELNRLLSMVAVVESARVGVNGGEANPAVDGDQEDWAADPTPAEAAIAEEGAASALQGVINTGRQVYVLTADAGALEQVRLTIIESAGAVDLISESLFHGLTGGAPHVAIHSALSPESFVSWLQDPSFPASENPTDRRLWWIQIDQDARLQAIPIRMNRPEASPAPAAQDQPIKQRRGPEYVRVEAARIDTLLNLAGEMVIARSGMSQVLPDLENAFPKNDLVARFSAASMQMGKLISELQKSVLKMRMVTIDQVFRRFTRPMRELAAESGKQVTLQISGGETEMDRTLVDLVYEPLLHLLRNAVDHGMESPEARQALGKPAAGTISMR
ncbi:MAG TPA: Hpt domain-containing protein, partial [Blastocatellia bacterium]|nr:Hpt domain-containing protein [Blastocatellia bacterium]